VCNDDREGFGPCLYEVTPSAETCDTAEDDDCDGETNEEGADCACKPGDTEGCYSGPTGTEDVGTCVAGTRTCETGGQWGACDEEVVPAADDCTNLLDEDCDGAPCGAPLWVLQRGDAGNQIVTAVAVDAAGDTFAAGHFTDKLDFGGEALQSNGATDLFVTKVNAKGATVWARSFGSASDDQATAIAVGPDGDVIVAGTFDQSFFLGRTELLNNGGLDAFVAKLDGASGDVAWAVERGFDGDQEPTAVTVAAAGDILVAGFFTGTFACPQPSCAVGALESAGGTDVFVMKLDTEGNVLGQRGFGGAANEAARAVLVDASGNVVVVGELAGTFSLAGKTLATTGPAETDVLILTLAGSDLAPLDARQLGDDGQQQATAAASANGDLYLAGQSIGVIDWGFAKSGEPDEGGAFVVKLAATADTSWTRTFAGFAKPNAITVTPAGRVAMAGFFLGQVDFGTGPLTDPASTNAFLVQLAADGSTSWAKAFGGLGASATDLGTAVAVAPNGNVVFGGGANSGFDFGLGPQSYGGGYDVALARFYP